MGNFCTCRRKNKKKIVLLLVGLDNAGKTAAARGLAGEPPDSVVPTVGFSIINLTYRNHLVKIFDLGGGANIRGIWHKYFVDAYGVIFVVDASDMERLDEAKQVLKQLLSHEKISRKPVLVLANKQDNEDALDEVDIIDKLDLESVVNGNECPTLVESCTASQGSNIDPGIKRGYNWLLNYILRNYSQLNKRVVEDVYQQLTLENQLRKERIDKIKALKEVETNKFDEIESYSNYERKINESDVSNSSSESFPPVYHMRDVLLERPRSAVQIVRQQLELNAPKKSSFVSRASNKTAPLRLYATDVPHSANFKRRKFFEDIPARNLKSAGDAPLKITTLPNVPTGDDFHKELVTFMGNLAPKGSNKENGLPKMFNGDMNGISIVDVDL